MILIFETKIFVLEPISLLDLLVRPFDLLLVLLQPLGHHRHDAPEPLGVDAGHVAGVDAVVDVVVVPGWERGLPF